MVAFVVDDVGDILGNLFAAASEGCDHECCDRQEDGWSVFVAHISSNLCLLRGRERGADARIVGQELTEIFGKSALRLQEKRMQLKSLSESELQDRS